MKFTSLSYELILILSVTLLALTPLHHAATYHANVGNTIDASHVAFDLPQAKVLVAGDEFPVYRFNPEWQSEIGRLRVDETVGHKVYCSFDPSSFRWPMGRHARVISHEGTTVRINAGLNLGFRPQDVLIVFLGRKTVGKIKLTDIADNEASGQILENFNNDFTIDFSDLTVSEFSVATQVAIYKNPVLSVFEPLVFIFVVAFYIWSWKYRKQSPFVFVAKFTNGFITCLRSSWILRYSLHLLIGSVFVWFIVGLSVDILVYLGTILTKFAYACGDNCSAPLPFLWLKEHRPVLYTIMGLLYCGILFRSGKSPILYIWRLLSFSGTLTSEFSGAARHIFIWALHLTIAYAFAHTLFAFILGNLNAAINLAWPGEGPNLQGSLSFTDWQETARLFRGIYEAVYFMVTNEPHFSSTQTFFLVLRYILWVLTIVGCLIGYCHSIVGYVWGKRIRNLDYTIVGWVVNAWCYGPLLGGVFWGLFPSFVGNDPAITEGFLLYANYVIECILNLMYMLSIWNLGTMFGVMTDKGVRTTGFYSVVRHPSYTLEAFMFLALESLSFNSFLNWVSGSMMFLLLWVRSERDDDFMSNSNPDYLEYKKVTTDKFLPGVY